MRAHFTLVGEATSAKLVRVLKKLRSSGHTMLVATHYLPEELEADTLVGFEDGRVVSVENGGGRASRRASLKVHGKGGALMGSSTARAAAASFLAVVTGLLAQLSFRVGPVPYTMQNVGFVLSGLLLPPKWAFASQLLYLAMVAAGFPLAAGFRGGFGVLIGPTGGYLAGFPLAALLTSFSRELYTRAAGRSFAELKARDVAALWLLSAAAAAPVYVLGFLVFSHWVSADPSLLAWTLRAAALFGLAADSGLAVAVASVLIFLPQDFLMDHPLALLTALRVARVAPDVYAALAGATLSRGSGAREGELA